MMLITVETLRAWLASLPHDARVRGYEGEGGSWIVVDLEDGEESLNTDEDE